MAFKGERHTQETRRKMSEAAKRRHERERTKNGIDDCYKLLVTAVLKQAVKDGAAGFFESGWGESLCAMVGFNSDWLAVVGQRRRQA